MRGRVEIPKCHQKQQSPTEEGCTIDDANDAMGKSTNVVPVQLYSLIFFNGPSIVLIGRSH